MRRFIISLLLAVVPAIGLFAQKSPQIKFDKTSHGFGSVYRLAGSRTYFFRFANIGDAPLVMDHLTTGCQCVKAEFMQKKILPGETGEVKVTYNPSGQRDGEFKKSITIASNAKTPYIRLFVSGTLTSSKPVASPKSEGNKEDTYN